MEELKIIGTSVSRVDGVAKVTGQAKYTGDMVVPDMVEGRFLRSPYPHARILSIDTKEAEQTEGVVAVFTGRDLSPTGMVDRDKIKLVIDSAVERGVTNKPVDPDAVEDFSFARDLGF